MFRFPTILINWNLMFWLAIVFVVVIAAAVVYAHQTLRKEQEAMPFKRAQVNWRNNPFYQQPRESPVKDFIDPQDRGPPNEQPHEVPQEPTQGAPTPTPERNRTAMDRLRNNRLVAAVSTGSALVNLGIAVVLILGGLWLAAGSMPDGLTNPETQWAIFAAGVAFYLGTLRGVKTTTTVETTVREAVVTPELLAEVRRELTLPTQEQMTALQRLAGMVDEIAALRTAAQRLDRFDTRLGTIETNHRTINDQLTGTAKTTDLTQLRQLVEQMQAAIRDMPTADQLTAINAKFDAYATYAQLTTFEGHLDLLRKTVDEMKPQLDALANHKHTAGPRDVVETSEPKAEPAPEPPPSGRSRRRPSTSPEPEATPA